MSLGTWILAVWAALACVAWIAVYAAVYRAVSAVGVLSEQDPPEPAAWPSLAVIIPAANEADTLEQALDTLLDEDYPDLRVVLIDDRSTDATSAIVDRLAARDPRVTAVHIDRLPEGWVGKVHANHVGAGQARAEWLLFTDADVHFQRGVLKKTVALCAARGLDHLTLVPDYRSTSFLQEVATTHLMVGLAVRGVSVGRPGSRAFAGIGQFNLVRREVFDRSEGFAWLRLEVIDDMGLALVMQRAGAKSALMIAAPELGFLWYPSLGAMARGMEKNLFAFVGRFRLGVLAARIFASAPVIFGPAVVLVAPSVRFLWPLVALALLSLGVASSPIRRRLRRRTIAVLCIPIGQILIAYMGLRSGYRCVRDGGVVWRGTHYDLESLRAGQRVTR